VSPVSAGSYLAVAVAGGTVSPAALKEVQSRAEDTSAILESDDSQQLAGLTRSSLLGDLFHAGTLAYFQQLDLFSSQQLRQAGARGNLAPSAGTYGYTPRVTTLFGIPQSIKNGGITMDLDRVARILGGTADDQERVLLNTQIGALSSALEHRVPEQQFSTEGNAVEAMSATKALAVANREGQRTYTLTPGNFSETLPKLNLSVEVESEIRSAVSAGKVVTTHTGPISVAGYNGAGYVILDPDTGSGAWKIAGGQDGGAILDPLTQFLGPVNQFLSTLFDGLSEFLKRAGELLKNDVLPSIKSLAKRNSYLGVLLSMAEAIAEGDGLLGVSLSILNAILLGALQSAATVAIAFLLGLTGLFSAVVIAVLSAIASFVLVGIILASQIEPIVRRHELRTRVVL